MRAFAAALGWVAWCCALALATPACRSTAEQGWSYERSGAAHVVEGAEVHGSVGESHYDLKLQGRSAIHGTGEQGSTAARAAATDWQCFLVVVGPYGRGAALPDSPRLSFGDGSPDVAGAGISTFCEPRFDFALPPGLLEAGADSGVRWTLRDGETELSVRFSADYLRGFLESLSWAGQVRAQEELAAPARERLLPEPH